MAKQVPPPPGRVDGAAWDPGDPAPGCVLVAGLGGRAGVTVCPSVFASVLVRWGRHLMAEMQVLFDQPGLLQQGEPPSRCWKGCGRCVL